MKTVTKLELSAIEDFATGCAILGSGGGGDPHAFAVALRALVEDRGPVPIIDPENVNDTDLIVTLGFVGAPVTLHEKLLSEQEIVAPIEAMQARLGRKIDAFVAAEIGGGNGLTPLIASKLMGVPVIDGDGMGRAFPLSDHVSFAIYGCSALPTVIGSEHGEIIIVEAGENHRVEQFSRAICVSMGSKCFAVDYPLSGAELKKYCVKNTISLSIGMGAALRVGRYENVNGIESLKQFLSAECGLASAEVFDGKITSVEHDTSGGFGVGTVIISRNGGKGDELEVDFQNEFLVARENGVVVSSTPDIISILDKDTLRNISSDTLRFGQRVKVFVIEAPKLMATSRALEVVGPQAFGYSFDYRPIPKTAEQGSIAGSKSRQPFRMSAE